jgi:glycosyltransferase A (GT-A) superfamily protein (DUF2064 family)
MSETNRRRCGFAVMAKAPRAGRVKTRLCPPLLPEEAMEMSSAFLRDITENLRVAGASASIDGFIAYAPAGDAHAFDGKLAAGTKLILADGTIDVPPGVRGFGACLLHAMQGLFALGYGAAVVLNSDSPTYPTAFLEQTAARLLLDGERAVLGPADDGGYCLLGLQAPHAAAFADIAWSTDVVAAQTRARVAGLGIELVELPPWYDVDDAAALRRLLAELTTGHTASPAPYPALASAAALERLGLPLRLLSPE